jgi:hypothetical protein
VKLLWQRERERERERENINKKINEEEREISGIGIGVCKGLLGNIFPQLPHIFKYLDNKAIKRYDFLTLGSLKKHICSVFPQQTNVE